MPAKPRPGLERPGYIQSAANAAAPPAPAGGIPEGIEGRLVV